MMKGIIAVSEGLGDIREMLEEEGYQVVDLEEGLGDVDMVITSGIDRNMSGVDLISTDVPVLDATGRRPDEVLENVRRSLELQK